MSQIAWSALRQELIGALGAQAVLDRPETLERYASDATFQAQMPALVVCPATTEQVAAVLRLASRAAVPVVPRGAGTSLSGGAVPVAGGIVLSLERMNRIREIDPSTSTATVEAGVVNADLQRAAAAVGLFFPPDPASWETCTLGGNVACGAGGPRCLKYGVTKDYVLGMTVALMDGRVLRLGGKLLKNATGYQLAQLFVGSEGTLGVITEVTLKLLPLPRERATAAVHFASVEAACRCATDVLGAGWLPATMELMDSVTLDAVERYSPVTVPLPAGATLLIEVDGADRLAVEREIEGIAAVCRASGAVGVEVASEPDECARLWAVRRAASVALGRVRPNKLGEDIVVPRDRIPEIARRIEAISRDVELPIAIFGHAGDGNLHPNILFDRSQPDELARVERAAEAIFLAALDVGGMLSGEHGVGTLKRAFLREAVGDDVLGVMEGIKQLFDPRHLLNPGKVYPSANESGHAGFLTTLPTRDSFATG